MINYYGILTQAFLWSNGFVQLFEQIACKISLIVILLFSFFSCLISTAVDDGVIIIERACCRLVSKRSKGRIIKIRVKDLNTTASNLVRNILPRVFTSVSRFVVLVARASSGLTHTHSHSSKRRFFEFLSRHLSMLLCMVRIACTTRLSQFQSQLQSQQNHGDSGCRNRDKWSDMEDWQALPTRF
jgi:hypothetical protein